MQRPSTRPLNFTPARSRVRRPEKLQGATDYLRADDKMAALLPAAMRMASLQKDCAALLPSMFSSCAILGIEAGQLTLSTPNAALAARLKQQLPKLQEGLQGRGWQVNSIRLKVQVSAALPVVTPQKVAKISGTGISAFAKLGETLEKTKRNAGLLEAVEALVRRRLEKA